MFNFRNVDGRRHEKHKDRMGKHERSQMAEFRTKMDKDRKASNHDRDNFPVIINF